ncbi:cold-shock protein [Ornithinimicrobium cerasi]|uniref:Cold-shock DNA-binding protein family n=1 Tax=Ornithinimicrobium cerasi TaxID=2248773 RepID=A0A285VQQ5_9MICO|nr:cold shock domain-containing protein [Ornithinimicrobium cerasi]SOC56404.1 cold-shock DNA-binding protein family [Ornithinimicrobium cerasi]
MPTGKVRFYDEDKGFGFLSSDEGQDVFVPRSALPEGVEVLKRGARVEFDIVAGKRGDQALHVRLLEPAPTVTRGLTLRDRKPAEEMVPVIEDLITLLDQTSNSLRRGHYPDRTHGSAMAKALRAVADQFEAGT